MSFFVAAPRFLNLLQVIRHVREEFLHKMRRSVSIRSRLHEFAEIDKSWPSAWLIKREPEQSLLGASDVCARASPVPQGV